MATSFNFDIFIFALAPPSPPFLDSPVCEPLVPSRGPINPPHSCLWFGRRQLGCLYPAGPSCWPAAKQSIDYKLIPNPSYFPSSHPVSSNTVRLRLCAQE